MKITVQWLQERIEMFEKAYWEERRWYYADFISDEEAEHHDIMSEIYLEKIEMYKRKLTRVRARESGDVAVK